MTVIVETATHTEFKRRNTILCSAQPGVVSLGIASFKSREELQECIECLQNAATVAWPEQPVK